MNAYERILEVMRKQGKKDNPNELQLARVENGKVVCKDQKLEEDDYLIADGITLKNNDVVLAVQISDSKYVVICKVVSV